MKRLAIAAIVGACSIWTPSAAIAESWVEILAKMIAGAYIDNVSVMTFNIAHDKDDDGKLAPWSSRRDRVVSIIRSQEPDVVGLQEAFRWQVTFLKDQLGGYASVG